MCSLPVLEEQEPKLLVESIVKVEPPDSPDPKDWGAEIDDLIEEFDIEKCEEGDVKHCNPNQRKPSVRKKSTWRKYRLETPEQRKARLKARAQEKYRRMLARETPEQRARRLEKNKIRMREYIKRIREHKMKIRAELKLVEKDTKCKKEKEVGGQDSQRPKNSKKRTLKLRAKRKWDDETPEQYKARLKARDQEKYRRMIARETPEQRARRLEKNRIREHEKRIEAELKLDENDSKWEGNKEVRIKEPRLTIKLQKLKERIRAESKSGEKDSKCEEEKEVGGQKPLRQKNSEKCTLESEAKRKWENEMPEQKQERLAQRRNETEAEKAARCEKRRLKLQHETPAKREARLKRMRQWTKERTITETPEQRKIRLEAKKLRYHQYREKQGNDSASQNSSAFQIDASSQSNSCSIGSSYEAKRRRCKENKNANMQAENATSNDSSF